MNDHPLLPSLFALMEQSRNAENAAAMQKYMKDQFPFLGIKSPERRNLSKAFIKDLCAVEDFKPYVFHLWEMPEREYQYIAVDFLVKKKKQLDTSHMDMIEYLLVNKSWWDTVDAIAGHLVGAIFLKRPDLIQGRGEEWLTSKNIWLQRSMILFQLKYKEKTNEELLFSVIKRTMHLENFFIQKAIGWTLREYSKTSPAAVSQFIENQDLSNLAKREGLKHINRTKNK